MFFHRENCVCEWALPVARVFLSALFIISGIGKILAFEQTVSFVTSVGLPLPLLLVIIAIVIEIGGGLSVLFGYKVFWGANSLALFALLTAVIFHNNIGNPLQQAIFLKNVAIAGGLIYVAHFGSGMLSIENKEMSPMVVPK